MVQLLGSVGNNIIVQHRFLPVAHCLVVVAPVPSRWNTTSLQAGRTDLLAVCVAPTTPSAQPRGAVGRALEVRSTRQCTQIRGGRIALAAEEAAPAVCLGCAETVVACGGVDGRAEQRKCKSR